MHDLIGITKHDNNSSEIIVACNFNTEFWNYNILAVPEHHGITNYFSTPQVNFQEESYIPQMFYFGI